MFGINRNKRSQSPKYAVSDDGCQSEGNQKLFHALDKQGYDVWLSTPSTNQSGSGTAVTFKLGKELSYKQIAERLICSSQTGHFIKRHFVVQN
ncbi:5'/3'-nucleotidase SurE [Vibrio parahaemolyticus]|uniref:5'/3'-nucleotidase SurE n=1 Tax=Vibrio parahaemolyticus TaxID=670 RepID=UPI0035AB93B7